MKKGLKLTHQSLTLLSLFFSCALTTSSFAMKAIEIGGQKLSPNDYLGSILNSTYQKQIQSLLQDSSTSLQQKITQLQAIGLNITTDAQKNDITIFPEQLEDAYAQALVTLFEQSKTPDAAPEAVSALSSLLNYAQTSPLLRSEQQAYVRDEMLPKAQAGISADEINAALQAPSYVAKINNFITLLDKAKGQATVDPSAQDAFGNALVTIFEGRTKEQPSSLSKVATLLNQALASPLLAPNQQAYVRDNMLPQIKRGTGSSSTSKKTKTKKAGKRKGSMPTKAMKQRKQKITAAPQQQSQQAPEQWSQQAQQQTSQQNVMYQ
jgi:hypothetical protein